MTLRPTLYSAWHAWSIALRQGAVKQRPARKYAALQQALDCLAKALEALPAFYAARLLHIGLLCDALECAPDEAARTTHEDELLSSAERLLAEGEAASGGGQDKVSAEWARVVSVALRRRERPPESVLSIGRLIIRATLQTFAVVPRAWISALSPQAHTHREALEVRLTQ